MLFVVFGVLVAPERQRDRCCSPLLRQALAPPRSRDLCWLFCSWVTVTCIWVCTLLVCEYVSMYAISMWVCEYVCYCWFALYVSMYAICWFALALLFACHDYLYASMYAFVAALFTFNACAALFVCLRIRCIIWMCSYSLHSLVM